LNVKEENMGRGEEKSGLMGSKWMTIALIVVLVLLAAILIWILKDPRGFDRFKGKKKPELKPVGSTGQQLRIPNDRPRLELVDDRLRVVAQLSWQKLEI
jgi:hypothetical protein